MAKLQILQGAGQIGGNIVLIESTHSRIIIDFGIPLTELDGNPTNLKLDDKKNRKYLPDIPDLYSDKQEKETVVLISHAHPDHYGLLGYIHKSVPIYALRETKNLIQASSELLFNNIFSDINVIPISKDIELRDFKIRAYPVNHSVAGACAYCITDKSGKKILYSGDIRTHGRENKTINTIIEDNKNIDYLIIEGTTLNRDYDIEKTEVDVENEMEKYFRENKLNIVSFSPLNAERFLSVYNACLKAGKTFVIDPYSAYILEQLQRKDLPKYNSKGIKVFCVPTNQSNIIFDNEDNQIYGTNKIEKEELRYNPTKYVIKDNYIATDYITKYVKRKDTNFIYSYWEGYMSKKNFRWNRYKNQLIHIHSSGHIYKKDLIDLIDNIKPEKIIPIHTTANKKFVEYFGDKTVLTDNGQTLEI